MTGSCKPGQFIKKSVCGKLRSGTIPSGSQLYSSFVVLQRYLQEHSDLCYCCIPPERHCKNPLFKLLESSQTRRTLEQKIIFCKTKEEMVKFE